MYENIALFLYIGEHDFVCFYACAQLYPYGIWSCCCVLQDKVLRVGLTGGNIVDGSRLQTVIVILKHHEAR